MADPLVKVAADIQQYGWHCLHVYPRQGEEGVGFTYSIGLAASYGHPEIMIFGLSRETSHGILNDCVEMIKIGTAFPANQPVPDVIAGDYQVYFKPVRAEHFAQYLGTAERHYAGKPFSALVMFWPSKERLFPWQSSNPSVQAEALGIV